MFLLQFRLGLNSFEKEEMMSSNSFFLVFLPFFHPQSIEVLMEVSTVTVFEFKVLWSDC